MTTELATQSNMINNLEDLRQVAQLLLASNYFVTKNATPEGKLSEIATKVLAGQEMGFKPFASAKGIYIIQGAPTVGGNLMATAVKNSKKYDYRIRQMSNDICKIEFFERVNGKLESLGVSEFTSSDAKAAGTQNMSKFPRNMLFNRAISNGVRWFCPDVFNGVAVYTPEEMGAIVDDNGDAIDAQWTTVPPVINTPAPQINNEPEVTTLQDLVTQYGPEAVMAANDGRIPATDEEVAYVAGVLAGA